MDLRGDSIVLKDFTGIHIVYIPIVIKLELSKFNSNSTRVEFLPA